MEQSNKHSPRVDEQLEHDQQSILQGQPVDARVDEQRRDAGVGPRPGQPSAAAQPPARQPGTSEGLTPLEIDLRSELASYVGDVTFPTSRSKIIDSVIAQNAPTAVIRLAERLPEDQTFDNMQEVVEASFSTS